jgi:hypothetical protein
VDDDRRDVLILNCVRIIGVACIVATLRDAPDLAQLLIAAALAALVWELRSRTPWR